MYRQGHLLLISVVTLPADVVPQLRDPDRGVVLAVGDLPRHAYAISSSRADLFRQASTASDMFVRINGVRPVLLRNDLHAPIRVWPGIYRVVLLNYPAFCGA